jgi:hypothetical protein
MKKLLTIVILAAMLSMTVPILAQNTPTAANVTQALSALPVVKAKWETPDEDLTRPFTQINPPVNYSTTKPITYWTVVTADSVGKIDDSYVLVYHPDGTYKYKVPLQEIPICPGGVFNTTLYNTFVSEITAADNGGSVTYGNSFNLTDVIEEVHQCLAKVFKGTEVIDYCQMCGQFTWTPHCSNPSNCTTIWVPSNLTNGYRVEAYGVNKDGATSTGLVNYFEYICTAGIETDFNKLDFGNVYYHSETLIGGDKIWNTPNGPACASGTGCRPPSVRNIGNIPVNLTVWQDDMQFGYAGTGPTKDWNVQWDARLGEPSEHLASTFDPFVTTPLDGGLDLCQLDKLSFSIYPKNIVSFGPKNGTVVLEPVKVPFPWWPIV